MEIVRGQENVEKVFRHVDLSRVNIPSFWSKIYKEQCVLSFHDTKSKGGLFVCLNSFQCFSMFYLEKYFEKTGYNIFLNISDVLVSQASEKGSLSNIYETQNSVVVICHIQNVMKKYVIPLPSRFIPSKVRESVTKILSSDSEFSKLKNRKVNHGSSQQQQQDVMTYEYPNPISIYSKHLFQILPENFDPKRLKCEKCDLKTNLWLNLSDGFIGCGRRTIFDQFPDYQLHSTDEHDENENENENHEVKVTGNNHGIEHYEETGYPLVVKLGTITSTSADVFSYPESSMVIDERLDDHLTFFGIDRSNMEKSDFSMDEINLDMNLVCSFQDLESIEKKVFVYGKGLTGLKNFEIESKSKIDQLSMVSHGYMNCVFQLLFSIDEIKNRFYDMNFDCYFSKMMSWDTQTNDDDGFRVTNDPSNDIECMLVKIANGLISGIYSYPKKDKSQHPKLYRVPKEEEESEGEKTEEEIENNDGVNTMENLQDGISPLFLKKLLAHPSPPWEGQGWPVSEEGDPASYFLRMIQCIDGLELKGNESKKNGSKAPSSCTSGFKFVVEERIQKIGTNEVFYREKRETVFSLPIDTSLCKNLEEYEKYRKKQEENNQNVTDIFSWDEPQQSDPNEPQKIVRPILDLSTCLNSYFVKERKIHHETMFLSTRFKSFPKYLIIKLQINKQNEHEPMIHPKMENVEEIDVSLYRSSGLQSFEKEMKKEEMEAHMKMMNEKGDVCVCIGSDLEDVVEEERSDGTGKYELFAVISHLGMNFQCGHCVCHIKKRIIGGMEEWIFFNDESVTIERKNVLLDNGYLYIYQRKT